MSHYTLQLLTEVFEAQGAPDAFRLAQLAVETLQRVHVLNPKKVAMAERDWQIRQLYAKGTKVVEIARRLSMSPHRVYDVLERRHP